MTYPWVRTVAQSSQLEGTGTCTGSAVPIRLTAGGPSILATIGRS
jgi:hypothetical protein